MASGRRLVAVWAAIAEGAARALAASSRHLAAGPLGAQSGCPCRVLAGDGGQQCPRVRVVGLVEDLVDAALLDDLAEIHDRDAVGGVVHDGQVVRHEEVGQAVLLLEVLEQVHDLGLHRDVQGGDRFVEHEQLRIDRQGPGDADALALPAGQLVGIAPSVLGAEADVGQQRRDPIAPLAAGRADAMHREHLGDRVGDRHARVERRVGVLEDDLDAFAQPAQLPGRCGQHVDAVEGDAPSWWPHQAQDGPRRGRLAAPGLTHERQRLATRDGEADAPDGGDAARRAAGQAVGDAAATREGDVQVLDHEQRRRAVRRAARRRRRCAGVMRPRARGGRRAGRGPRCVAAGAAAARPGPGTGGRETLLGPRQPVGQDGHIAVAAPRRATCGRTARRRPTPPAGCARRGTPSASVWPRRGARS